jgi:hypothetical protein
MCFGNAQIRDPDSYKLSKNPIFSEVSARFSVPVPVLSASFEQPFRTGTIYN